ncbi:group 1 family glycosyltransferase [Cucumis melo var. makuwa]|uniref:Group 1 family glycosyltransferase n=2 Tax=Cucumis melo TaxID=3656 RepID=A0A5D3CDB1_CUCMM|nr:group 1 family glycosyltransferase [Cucumis melo var. makuwa]TYK09194.1 group 1 family glycosyltransferase [Cucumis melo var. makuwa]
MDADHRPNDRPFPNPNQPHRFKCHLSPIHFSSILILLLAISFFAFPKTNFYKSQSSKLTNLLKTSNQPPGLNPSCVLWMAPFLSGGGYSSEAWSYILALRHHITNPGFRLVIRQHGDLESVDFWEGLPESVRNLAIELHRTRCRMNETVVICHSEPGAWNPPLFETLPCPPGAYRKFKSVIGRTMFETDRVTQEHVNRCNVMDYVWVPSEFHVSTFVESGVDPSKIVKVVQPVDVNFFDPLKYKPFSLESVGTLVLGGNNFEEVRLVEKKRFVFLSIFKWEFRKGWDLLLEAYLKEFSKKDEVGLFLLTNPYHTESDFGNKILDFVENSDLQMPLSGWAPVYVVDIHIPQTDLPRVYKAADAFVLPSRGEGWGRPLVEAMAMSLPVIATNWSGPTEFLTDENSYPLPVERMSEVKEEPFKGHMWAEPSISKLQVLMREVTINVEEAKDKGRRAREDMINRFSPDIVADIVHRQIENIFHEKR